MSGPDQVAALLAAAPVVLAPMEDVTDAGFRALCRDAGARVCVTEFVRAEELVAGARRAARKIHLGADDQPTAIQIYGSNPALLIQAAAAAAAAGPAFIDVNCGCWVPRVVRGGAGAAWLRDPAAMVAMAAQVVRATSLPVTVKTRIGWGPAAPGGPGLPIVELARRLEDVGVAGLTIHCRLATAGHSGAADWSWAQRAREAVRLPVVVNGDVATGPDVVRALADTGCAGVMIGRAAISHPWVFREATALLTTGQAAPPPSTDERRAAYRRLLAWHVGQRGPKFGVTVTRRHAGLLGPMLTPAVRAALMAATAPAEVEAIVASA